MSKNFEGKVFVIMGASSGQSVATARLLSVHRTTVMLGGSRTDRAQSLVDELTGSGAPSSIWNVRRTIGAMAGSAAIWPYCISDAIRYRRLAKDRMV